jgi:uncharacterized glyoxalase superfamily protein PhnB
MKMNTYVNFSGSCAEAFRYYEKHLGAKVGTMMTHGQSPEGFSFTSKRLHIIRPEINSAANRRETTP